jgi:hypothetical protein
MAFNNIIDHSLTLNAKRVPGGPDAGNNTITIGYIMNLGCGNDTRENLRMWGIMGRKIHFGLSRDKEAVEPTYQGDMPFWTWYCFMTHRPML